MEQLIAAILTMVAGVLVCAAYFWSTNLVLDWIFPSKGKFGAVASRNLRIANSIRPWLFLAPALLALTLYLVYPVVQSVWLSLHGRGGQNFVGLSNYSWMINDGEFRQSIFNNFLWLLVVPALSTFFGLIIAALTDRIWWGNIAKTRSSCRWRFPSSAQPSSGNSSMITGRRLRTDRSPERHRRRAWRRAAGWITLPFWNNFFLMVILIWIQTGFAMVILSAALRGIPEETIEAAVIDGANGWQIFFKIMVPQIWGTIAVVWTTITILVLKVFDIVLAMTNGQWQSQVLANLMFDWMFRGGGDFGRGAAIAVVIMILVVPIMIWNIRNATRESGGH